MEQEIKELVKSTDCLLLEYYKVCKNYQNLIRNIKEDYYKLFLAYSNFLKHNKLCNSSNDDSNSSTLNILNYFNNFKSLEELSEEDRNEEEKKEEEKEEEEEEKEKKEKKEKKEEEKKEKKEEEKKEKKEEENTKAPSNTKIKTKEKKKKKKKKCVDTGIYKEYNSLESDLKLIYDMKNITNKCCFIESLKKCKDETNFNSQLVGNYTDMFLSGKLFLMSIYKNRLVKTLNDYCRNELKRLQVVSLAGEICLNNLRGIKYKQLNYSRGDKKKEDNVISECFELANMIKCCRNIIHEVKEKLLPFFSSFNIFYSNILYYDDLKFKSLEELKATTFNNSNSF